MTYTGDSGDAFFKRRRWQAQFEVLNLWSLWDPRRKYSVVVDIELCCLGEHFRLGSKSGWREGSLGQGGDRSGEGWNCGGGLRAGAEHMARTR